MPWGSMAQGLSLLWAAGVLNEYRGLCYPHKAWLFHAHTVAAAAAVVAAVFGTVRSQEAAKNHNKENRLSMLARHRSTMQWAVSLSALAAAAMLYKKAVHAELGWLLVSGRMPSSHSWVALAWLGPVVIVLGLTGLIVHRAGPSFHPHPLLVRLSEILFGSLGNARKALAPWHRNAGLVGTTVVLVAAAYGLTEKNDVAFRRKLAYLLGMIWASLVGQKFLSRRD
jgi:hypothetical protein